MQGNDLFKRNLQALFQQDEILAARLFNINENSKYDVFVNQNDPIDINIINKETLQYMYENPAKDIQNMLENTEREYKRYPIMYFYGLGNGVFYKALLANKTHQRIVVIEPDLEIIYIALNMIDLTQELASERLTLFYSDFAKYAHFVMLVTKKEIKSYSKLYELHIHTPFYEENFADDIIEVNQNIARAIAHMFASHGNSIDDNLQGVDQHFRNLTKMIKGYAYKDLIRARHKKVKTAVIVATGPSLTKQLPLLKKIAPYVSVISVDASYPILLKHGIKPDYVTSIERVELTSTFFDHKDEKFDKDIYFIVASLTHPKTVEKILPRRLVLTMRPSQEELRMKIDKYGFLGIGHSTANQAYQLAYVLEHENIVLIGQDLAFGKDGASHAEGHAFIQQDEFLYVTAYGGEGEVRTTYAWKLFKNQYEKDVEEANTNDVKTYNCTEGGARINGCIEKPFNEIVDEILSSKKPKKLKHIKKANQKEIDKNLLTSYKYIKTKLSVQNKCKAKCEKVFLKLTPKIDRLLELKKESKINETHFDELVSISEEIDRLKDFFSTKKNMRYAENILSISVFFQELELAKIAVAPSETVEQKINKLLEWVEIHKYWIFSVAGGLNADIQTTINASQDLLAELKKRNLIKQDDSFGDINETFVFRRGAI
ncbi:hypothetical protein LMG7974_00793 [Campylobacter majalis]|uniref:6-hydroxymethylpterin diphosphokinase MptE-like domain-containing protein n=1 Tax=Campylobacter majalis TaxID=2790656 RepID=A0ABM8Q5C3_9BACT|nr:6-hydroxymethylpterin diphosphokinase MptE-like protein [Campylobacter majalis]CAD7288022.1 hypothetical protein LMG7974_00793 [Campylobacter majalis]